MGKKRVERGFATKAIFSGGKKKGNKASNTYISGRSNNHLLHIAMCIASADK